MSNIGFFQEKYNSFYKLRINQITQFKIKIYPLQTDKHLYDIFIKYSNKLASRNIGFHLVFSLL